MTRKIHKLEITKQLESGNIFHYTCNPPKKKTLEKYNIRSIGEDIGCNDSREILIIPPQLYKENGYYIREDDLKIVSEALLRELS